MTDVLDLSNFELEELINPEECSIVENNPHIHIHALSEEEDIIEQGWGESELCCHGCGDSVIVRFNVTVMEDHPEGSPEVLDLTESFCTKHELCATPYTFVEGTELPQNAFNVVCPKYRRCTTKFIVSEY